MLPVFNLEAPKAVVTVLDEVPGPFPGVGVFIDGKFINITDADGTFFVEKNVSDNSVIEFKQASYHTQSYKISQLPKTVKLQLIQNQLENKANVPNDYKAPNYWLLGAGIVGLGLLGFLAYKKAKTTNYKRAKL